MSNNKGQQDQSRQQLRVIRRGPGRRGRVEKAKDPRGALGRLLGYLGSHRKYIALALVFTILSTLLKLAAPYYIGAAIDQYVIPRDWSGLVRISVTLVVIYGLTAATDIAVGWVMATISQRILKKMRKHVALKSWRLCCRKQNKINI